MSGSRETQRANEQARLLLSCCVVTDGTGANVNVAVCSAVLCSVLFVSFVSPTALAPQLAVTIAPLRSRLHSTQHNHSDSIALRPPLLWLYSVAARTRLLLCCSHSSCNLSDLSAPSQLDQTEASSGTTSASCLNIAFPTPRVITMGIKGLMVRPIHHLD